MGYVLEPSALLGAASGVAIAGLGAALLRVRPWRASGLAFSIFAILWGLQVLAANLGQMGDDVATARPWTLLFVLLQIPVYAPLLAFALLYAQPRAAAMARVVVPLLALPALVLVLLFFAAPQLFVEDIVLGADGRPSLDQGPLFEPVQAVSALLAFVAALGLVAWKLSRAEGEASRAQLALVTAALLVFVSYRAPAFFLGPWLFGSLAGEGQAWAVLRVAAGALGLWLVLFVVARVAVREEWPWRDLLLACGTVPVAVGALELVVAASGLPRFSTVGLWRLAMVALLAYAIARYRLFDIEMRLRTLAPAAAHLVASLFGLEVVWSVAQASFTQQPLWTGLVGLALAAGFPLAARAWRAGFRRLDPAGRDDDYVSQRKREVYRAALEKTRADGRVDAAEQAFLADLRVSLGLSDEEHQALVRSLGPMPRAA